MARSKFKKALLTVAVIWAFLVAGAGTYFGLRYGLKMRDEEQVVAELEGSAVATEEEMTAEEMEATGEPVVEEAVAVGPSPFAGTGVGANGTNSASTYDAVGHVMGDGLKYIYYKTMVWGTVVADFEDFRAKVAETLGDARGWARMGLKFVEVSEGQDVNIVLSDAASLEGYNGYCSGSLSCTSGLNEVIINDERWREGTAETMTGGMTIRDYQNMVVNHEMGHWLGHYAHLEACEADGGVAPVMLQQSTGLRNCRAFNPWPLDSELWTLR